MPVLPILPAVRYPIPSQLTLLCAESLLRLGDVALDRAQGGEVDLAKVLVALAAKADADKQRDALDDVLGLQQVPPGQRDLGAGTDRDGEDVVVVDLGARQAVEGAEHVLVGEVVAQAEDELDAARVLVGGGRRVVRVDEALGDLALVDKGRPDLEVGLALHDLDIPLLGDGPLELLVALARHVQALLGVGQSVVPRQGASLADPVGEGLEDVHDLGLPAHVELVGEVDPLVGAGVLHEAAVLGAEAQAGDVAEVLLQKLLVAARDDPDGVPLVAGEGLEGLQDALRGDGGAGLADDGGEGAVVVEHEEALAGVAVGLEHEGAVEQGRGVDVLLGAEDVDVLADKVVDPALDVAGGDVVVEARLHGHALVGGHGEGVVDLDGDAAQVPGVDVDGVLEAAGGAAELGQDEGAVALALADDVLHARRVHAVADRGDEANVGGAQQGEVLVLAEVLGVVLDGGEAEAAVHAVDAHDELVDAGGDAALGVVVLLLLDAGGGGDLDQHDLFAPVGVHFEEALKGLQLLGDAADGVEAVAADNDLLALVQLLEGVVLFGDGVGPGVHLALVGVDADGEDADLDAGAVGVDAAAVRGEAEDAGAAAGKVARVAVGLEADEVGAEYALEDLLAAGQAAQELGAGEGRVQEEGDVHVGDALAQHAGQQHEVVVVDDDDVAGLVELDDAVGKLLVHAVVVGPLQALLAAVGGLVLLVVEEGVEVVLGVAAPPALVLEEDALVLLLVVVAEPDRHRLDGLAVGQLRLEAGLVLLGQPEALARRRRRQAGVAVNGDRGRQRVERGEVDGGRGRGAGRREDILGGVDLAGPGDDGVVPGRLVGGEVGEGVEEGGLAAAGFQFLEGCNDVSAGFIWGFCAVARGMRARDRGPRDWGGRVLEE
ncbi:uncharacterized protein ColSpa_10675 [Colletotrichum spaethianum]|uniref:Uncharacterized protein n=1 Tax=Colletotrichum spaethianum TaxID=700344 RepID=A0AA37PE21_9PEZI|nr:uncharacterized protein ColSpa_10675 [Colletotrichum spaethianum]GKT50494.1 hypothetical protein ColSpa_10675 [Colletotrichum spaethianum]